MLALAFSIAFFGIKRTYPNLRGINTIAISFMLCVPGTFLIAQRGTIPYFISVVIANIFIFGSFVFLYRGILRFIGSRRSAMIPITASCFAVAILFYYSQIQDRVAPRIVAISITAYLVRARSHSSLFRKSLTFTSPKAMRLFAAVYVAFFAAVTVNCGIFTILHGSPSGGLESNGMPEPRRCRQCGRALRHGPLHPPLSSSELIAASRDESQKDSSPAPSTARGGIEVKLVAELKRMQGGKQKLSIALIDVDYFKSINDIQGHAAGDVARDVAETISTHLRGRDYPGRYGGDVSSSPSFPTGSSRASSLASPTASLTRSAISASPPEACLSPSASSLTEAVTEDDAVTLIARADKALYQAKSDGRNCRRVITANADATPDAATAPVPGILLPGVESSLLN